MMFTAKDSLSARIYPLTEETLFNALIECKSPNPQADLIQIKAGKAVKRKQFLFKKVP